MPRFDVRIRKRQQDVTDRSCREITIVAHDIGPIGGMEKVLAELVSGLCRRGHEVAVIARTCELPPGVSVEFHRVRGPARPFLIGYPWFMLVGSLVLARWRRGLVQATGSLVANRVDVISVHWCHQVESLSPSRPSLIFRLNIRLVTPLLRVTERLCFFRNRRAMFVCVSEGSAQEIRDHYPELAGNVRTIQNGVDAEAFFPGARRADARSLRRRLELNEGRLLAVFVGGMEPQGSSRLD
jgi:UDP-glucose:(heptosyl)LPS alpha-1,3-glucosyltransferase